MTKASGIAVILMAGGVLAACSVRDEGNQTAATTTTIETKTTGVTREEAAPAPVAEPTPMMQAAPAIQTQPGPKGNMVSLNKVAVTGDILTVSLSYAGGTCCSYVKLDEVSIIDDATSQRIGVLKDNTGKWMAAPLGSNGRELRINYLSNAPTQVWFKFPAPPATSKTVSVAIPEVAPFDAVPVTR